MFLAAQSVCPRIGHMEKVSLPSGSTTIGLLLDSIGFISIMALKRLTHALSHTSCRWMKSCGNTDSLKVRTGSRVVSRVRIIHLKPGVIDCIFR